MFFTLPTGYRSHLSPDPARFYDLPADVSQLRHQFAQSGQLLSNTDLLRAAKHLGLKAGSLTMQWSKLAGSPLHGVESWQGEGRRELKKLVKSPWLLN